MNSEGDVTAYESRMVFAWNRQILLYGGRVIVLPGDDDNLVRLILSISDPA